MITINRRNYKKHDTVIELDQWNITEYVTGINYTATQEKEFGRNLGLYPSFQAVGNIVAEGSITLTDAGIDKLNEIARNAGVSDYLFLGQTTPMDITISYTTYDGLIKTDVLHIVHFLNYTQGINKDDIINEREVNMIIGQIVPDLNGAVSGVIPA